MQEFPENGPRHPTSTANNFEEHHKPVSRSIILLYSPAFSPAGSAFSTNVSLPDSAKAQPAEAKTQQIAR